MVIFLERGGGFKLIFRLWRKQFHSRVMSCHWWPFLKQPKRFRLPVCPGTSKWKVFFFFWRLCCDEVWNKGVISGRMKNAPALLSSRPDSEERPHQLTILFTEHIIRLNKSSITIPANYVASQAIVTYRRVIRSSRMSWRTSIFFKFPRVFFFHLFLKLTAEEHWDNETRSRNFETVRTKYEHEWRKVKRVAGNL